jgi:hypothetical protein
MTMASGSAQPAGGEPRNLMLCVMQEMDNQCLSTWQSMQCAKWAYRDHLPEN